jgi:arylsulfatase A-like enzyme
MRSRPDVVVVVLDCARAFDVSHVTPAGASTTPTIDRLGEESLTFAQATSTSCWTLPGHASLFTGLMPSRHGAHELSLRLPTDVPTLAELLAAAGYLTLGVTCNDLVTSVTGLDRGFAWLVEERDALPAACSSLAGHLVARVGALRQQLQRHHARRRFAHDHGGRRANQLLHKALRRLPPERPLLLFVNYLETHLPYQPPDDALLPFLPPGASLEEARKLDQITMSKEAETSEGDLALLHALYRGALRYADSLVSELLAQLRAAGRLEHSLLVVTSDHGENLGDHGLMDHHCSLHESVLRVPLVVRFPGATEVGVRQDLATLLDVLPTVCEVVGLPTPPTQGESLAAPLQRSFAVAEYLAPHPDVRTNAHRQSMVDLGRHERGLRSIRTATCKYISASDGRHELYDLAADPMETVNLYDGHPERIELARLLARWEATEGGLPLGPAQADADLVARLAALGYIDEH